MEGIRPEKEVLSVTVDRKSGYVFVEKLLDKRAHLRKEGWVRLFHRLPRGYLRSLTLDNGLENWLHHSFTQHTGCPVYFCHPYHAWEKGTVENTIGLIRRYLPKKTSLRTVDSGDLLSIQNHLNDRPRKRLGFLTPYEVLFIQPSGALHA
jgi:IS30 family transposase